MSTVFYIRKPSQRVRYEMPADPRRFCTAVLDNELDERTHLCTAFGGDADRAKIDHLSRVVAQIVARLPVPREEQMEILGGGYSSFVLERDA